MAIIREDIGDAAADALTQYTMAVGDVFQGTLYPTDDRDWVRVELTAGKVYEVTLNSEQPCLFELFNAGDYIAIISAVFGGTSLYATWAPTVSGTYYLNVGAIDATNTNVCDYEITIAEKFIEEGNYDEIADYLTDGFAEAVGDARYAFDVGPGGELTADITDLTIEGQYLARRALEAWTYATGISFRFVDDANAHITFEDFYQGAYTFSSVNEGVIISSHVNISTYWLNTHGTTIDSFSFTTYIHEIGHALGLGHPGPYNTFGTYGNENIFLIDSAQATVMSYFDQAENTFINASHAYPVTPMIADIIAIQNLYGVPAGINTGNTVYGYESNADGYLGSLLAQWAAAGNPLLGIRVDSFSKPELADLDGDGDPDLVVGGEHGLIYYFENTGTPANPQFIQRTGSANPLDGVDVGYNSAPAFVDLDGDDDSDLVVGSSTGLLYYFENTGTVTDPRFTQRIGSANPLDEVDMGSDSAPAFADLDGDADPDLLVGNFTISLYYFENTGTPANPSFVERTGAENPLNGIAEYYDAGPLNREPLNFRVPAFADLDSDQDFDLIVGYDKGDIIYYENIGTAAGPDFTLQTHTGTANLLYGAWVDYYGAPEFIDLDNDKDLDLIAGDRNGAIHYFENIGTAANPHFSAINLGRPITFTIYDSSGIDTLDLRTDPSDQFVDLNPEGISDVYGLVGNVIISRGTWIENFIAGSGNDRVIGNAAANSLEGNDGDDKLWGNGGDDVLEGGSGADRLDGGSGMDRVSYRSSDAGVMVNLMDESAGSGHAEGDVIVDIENVTGSSHPDVLVGDDDNNYLDGGGGDDSLRGNGGDDILEGGAGADRLDGGPGTDWLSYAGSDGSVSVRLYDGYAARGHAEGDTLSGFENLRGSAYADTLAGNGRANRLEGGAGNDRMLGGSGDDILDGGPGADRLDGGAGTDWLSYARSATGVTVNLKDGTGAGGDAEGDVIADVENVAGSNYEDALTGDAGANRLTGADGDDALWGGSGDDILDGGPGSDRLDGGAGSDTVVYRQSDEAVTVNLEAGTGAGGHAEGDELADVENIEGSAYDDMLTGSDRANRLEGDSGDDVLEGGAGADQLDGGPGTDWLSYAGSDARVVVDLLESTASEGHAEGDVFTGIENVMGSDHNDRIMGNNGANHLDGGDGDDGLWGGNGDDLIIGGNGHNWNLDGGNGNDKIWGGNGIDWMNGGDGADELWGGDGDDSLDGDSGDDRLYGGKGNDSLLGDRGDDLLEGGDGDDSLWGNAGDDVMKGGAGDDELISDAGADFLDGGPGVDTVNYWFSNEGVTVNLVEGTGKGGDAEGDVLTGIEHVRGSHRGDNVLVGDSSDNHLFGYDGNDELRGNDGDDYLEGDRGDDVLWGGGGNDVMDGGLGADTAIPANA